MGLFLVSVALVCATVIICALLVYKNESNKEKMKYDNDNEKIKLRAEKEKYEALYSEARRGNTQNQSTSSARV